jgi:hypothetical protein
MKHSFPLMTAQRRIRPPIILMILGVILTASLLAACGGSSAGGLAVGDTAPAFNLPSASGDQVSLSDYRGSKPVLLYFHMADG